MKCLSKLAMESLGTSCTLDVKNAAILHVLERNLVPAQNNNGHGYPAYLANTTMYQHANVSRSTRNNKCFIDSPHPKVIRWTLEETYAFNEANQVTLAVWAVYMEIPYFPDFKMFKMC